jgi:hypothetical protein
MVVALGCTLLAAGGALFTGGALFAGSALFAGGALFAGSAWAQDYPNRPINMGPR